MAKNKNKSRPVKSKKGRVQKKHQTREAVQVLESGGLSRKQIKALPATVRTDPQAAKKAVRAKKEKDRVARNRQALLNDGIPLSIIKSERLDRKSYADIKPGEKSEWKRRGQKIAELERNGIKYNKSDLKLSWPRLIEKYGPGITPPEGYKIRGTSGNKKKPKKPPFNPMWEFSGPEYLYIGAAEVQGGFSLEDLSDVSDDRLKEMILERIRDSESAPDDSGSLYCIFKFEYGTRRDCEILAEDFYSRGYKLSGEHLKLTQNRYMKVTISNRFYQREFWELIYNCITQMKNEDVKPFLDKMRSYCNANNFPFMDNLSK